MEIGDVGQQPQRRPGQVEQHRAVLLDLNLPDMSGFEVLRSLRASKVRTPTLILSGIARIEDKVKGFGFGADDYMTKPFHKEELVDLAAVTFRFKENFTPCGLTLLRTPRHRCSHF